MQEIYSWIEDSVMRRLRSLKPQSPLFFITIYSLSAKTPPFHRQVTSYKKTKTASLGPLPFKDRKTSALALVDAYQNHIIYNAEWRVILYFLLLVIYHNSKHFIIIGRTKKQHGSGDAKHQLHACHSSFFPSLYDFSADTKDLLSPNQNAVFDHTDFEENNNMTVCAPRAVNEVDQFFEGIYHTSIYRKKALAILNHVSTGRLHPEKGMKFFFAIMKQAMAEARLAIETQGKTKKAYRAIVFLQEKGTFLDATQALNLRKQFIQKIIRRAPGESKKSAYQRTRKELLDSSYHPEWFGKF